MAMIQARATSQLQTVLGFNWVFLVELLSCGILTLFFLFYFNRLFASLVSRSLRAWTWRRYGVYVHIQELQISLLGGRIFFKGVRYVGNNESIIIHSGSITWRYWLRKCKGVALNDTQGDCLVSKSSTPPAGEELQSRKIENAEQANIAKPANLPCRLNIALTGVEWFIYNRSAAYDAILDSIDRDAEQAPLPQEKPQFRERRSRQEGVSSRPAEMKKSSNHTSTEHFKARLTTKFDKEAPSTGLDEALCSPPDASRRGNFGSSGSENDASILSLLPIFLDCTKVAVVLGNQHTKSVMVTKADRVSGEIDACRCPTIDKYRQLIDLKFEHPVVRMKPNEGYKGGTSRTEVDTGSHHSVRTESVPRHVRNHSRFRLRSRTWYHWRDIFYFNRTSTDSLPRVVTHEPELATETSNNASWQGLSRYLVEPEQEHKPAWDAIEYAAISTIVDSPEAAVKYYWDVPGTVSLSGTDDMTGHNDPSNVNGQTPPGWGAEILLKGALVNYGPWADRQRADMLRVFFPGLCRDAVPTGTLARGERRIPTQLKVYIELDKETTFRIPIREESKNWSWAKRADTMERGQKDVTGTESRNWKRKSKKGNHRGETRPFGWLDVKLPSDSTLRYTMDMVAGPCGFTNVVDLCLPHAEITTSVNHGLLLKSTSNRIICDLSNPLQWNGLRSWKFDIQSNGLELFFLREHIFLLNDLIDDWTSGPMSEYLTFSPFQYLLDLRLGDFRLYLNVNDSNIIDSPSDFDDNNFIVIFGRELRADILLPVQVLRPLQNTISFTIEAEHGGMKLRVPPWNTQATFLDSADLAQLEVLKIAGKYQYCETASTSNTDTLLLDVYCEVLSAQLYGFVIRYFLLIKDNYFGDDIRFKTLEEYQELLRMSQSERAQNRCIIPHKQSSDLDVILSVTANDSIILIPSNLYSALKSSCLTIAHLSADFRFTNYYMELDISMSTLAMSHCNEDDDRALIDCSPARTQLFIDGLAVASHRLFGLPPIEPTYVCNWDFIIGDVNGECTVEFVSQLMDSIKAFALSFNDDENALPSLLETALHDVTFLRFSLSSINVCLCIRDCAFLATTGPISAVLSDLSNTDYSQKFSLEVPGLCMSCFDVESALRQRSRPQHLVKTHAFVQTTLFLTVLTRSSASENERKLQRAHIRRHDRRTKRVGFLAPRELHDDIIEPPVILPAMNVPPMPIPIYEAKEEAIALQPVLLNHDFEYGFITHPQVPAMLYDLNLEHFVADHGSRASTGTVEDFPSKSPSHSLEVGSGTLSSYPKSEHHTSSDWQSPFGSKFGNTGAGSPNLAFSNRYSAPCFPLGGVRPNKQDLPMPPIPLPKDAKSKLSLNDVHVKPVPEDSTHSSFVVQFPHGITGFLNQTAVLAAAELLNSLQPTSPADILDTLQIDAVKKILGVKDRKRWSRETLDCRIQTSGINLRFLGAPPDSKSPAVSDVHDQYDVSLTGLDTIFSSEDILMSAEAATTRLCSMHFLLCSAVISAKEKYSDVSDSHTAVKLVIDDLTFWLTTNEVNSMGLAFNCLDLSIASTKITYLSSLLVRTQTLANEFRKAFSIWSQAQLNRMRLLTHLLVTIGPQTADPLFITRPSYVLRAATNHLRTNDSWKLVTRLRHIYNSLSIRSRREISARCLKNTEIVPVDSRERFLATFHEWRGWDLDDIDSCVLIEKLYSSTTGNISSVRPLSRDLTFSLEVGCVRVVLDRGPKQSEMSIRRLTTMFRQHATNIGDQNSFHPQISTRQKKLLQVLCRDFAVVLNWELYEVAESASKFFQSSPDTLVSSKTYPQQLRAETLHLLVTIQTASVAIDTINLRCHLVTRNSSVSYVADGDGPNSTDVAYTADTANANTQSHGQELASVDLSHPSVCYSHRTRSIDDASTVLFKIASNCRGLLLNVHQDVLILAEALNLFLKDEIAQIHQLMHTCQINHLHSSKNRLSVHNSKINYTFNVALFLDMYRITVPLLQSLAYNISGLAVRASITAQGKSDIVLDFDIKENSHELHNHVAGRVHNVSSFVIPTTNGRVVSQLTSRETRIGLFVLVEPISLDASALYNLLFALGRPEISSMLSDAREVVKTTEKRAKEIFSEQPMPLPEAADLEKTVIYDAHLTVAGFDVFANAKGSPEFEITKLYFSLGCLKLVSTNRLDQDGKVLAFPDSRLTLRHVEFHISRGNGTFMQSCGSLTFGAVVTTTTKLNDAGREVPLVLLDSSALAIELFAETASSVVDVLAHLQTRIKNLDLSREFVYLHKIRGPRPYIALRDGEFLSSSSRTPMLLNAMYSLELLDVQIRWFVATNDDTHSSNSEYEDLVLSLKRVNLSTRKPNFAKLKIEDLQLQMVPTSEELGHRTLNSALLPEIIFNVGYVTTAETRRLAFQAAGKSLDLRLTSHCIIPAAKLQKSISSAVAKVRSVSGKLATAAIDVSSDRSRPLHLFGKKRLESLLVDADFAGAVVYLSGATSSRVNSKLSGDVISKHAQGGKYEQSSPNDVDRTVILRAPGLAWKIEYRDNGAAEPSLVAEVKVDASSNILYPAVVPLILEITSTIKDVVSQSDQKQESADTKTSQQAFMNLDDENILTADPSAVLGRTRLNLGLRICRQEFSLSCQPISRVAVNAHFSDIYMTINNVRSLEHGHFLAVSTAFSGLQTSIQHVYSRESTGSFGIDSIFLSLMNSKHVSGVSGISVILRISPMMVLINGKQLQDFLLFREIWMPRELRGVSMTPIHSKTLQPQTFLVQRYQQVAATGAFPWNATVSIAELEIRLDLGQTIGKPTFVISNFWISSKKSSDWEQNLCLGFDDVRIDSTGRTSGLITLQQVSIRTSIHWPSHEMAKSRTPLVQGCLSFDQLQMKAAFDYQSFVVADISFFHFLMYNARNGPNDRLVAILNGEAAHIFCTTATASQALALYQAFERLIQEKQSNYETSLQEIEKFLNRNPSSQPTQILPKNSREITDNSKISKSPISLHTDVIVSLETVNIGAFPTTFADHQVFKLEALDAQARFAVAMNNEKIHSILGLTLGQLRIGLAGVKNLDLPKAVGELSIGDVVMNATGSRGGTILKVPKVEATMETWQSTASNHIDYVFKSSFEGKVEIGWNYSRIAYIRNMWASHTKALAQRLGKPLPPSAVKITGVPDEDGGQSTKHDSKITAEVNVPQSRYQYTALQPPIIETPQLREMGEATPPLEWIGLHRDKLPNLTHQILIVPLLELASEVEDAYAKILGSS